MSNHERANTIWRLLNLKHHHYCSKYCNLLLVETIYDLPDALAPHSEDENIAFNYHKRLIYLLTSELDAEYGIYRTAIFDERERLHRFNQPTAYLSNDVLDYYSRADFWTLGEAATLINNRNPKEVTEVLIEMDESTTRIGRSLKNTLELLERSLAMGMISLSSRPIEIIEWARLKHFELPTELVKLSLERGKNNSNVTKVNRLLFDKSNTLEQTVQKMGLDSQNEKPIAAKERESLLKLILGISMKGYRYDPKSTRSKEIKEMSDDLRELNLSLDEDTIRKYLNEAKALFSDKLNRTE